MVAWSDLTRVNVHDPSIIRGEDGTGYDYVTFVFDSGVTYKGIFYKQHKENEEEDAVMTFTAIGDNNKCIWGSME